MSLEEITGAAPDPNCLHCALAPQVNAALKQRSAKDVAGELLQMVGEIIASTGGPDSEDILTGAVVHLMRTTRQARAGLRAAGKIR